MSRQESQLQNQAYFWRQSAIHLTALDTSRNHTSCFSALKDVSNRVQSSKSPLILAVCGGLAFFYLRVAKFVNWILLAVLSFLFFLISNFLLFVLIYIVSLFSLLGGGGSILCFALYCPFSHLFLEYISLCFIPYLNIYLSCL